MVVPTGETALYGNIILTKGVVADSPETETEETTVKTKRKYGDGKSCNKLAKMVRKLVGNHLQIF